MRIIFICGSLENGKDGVGDYTRKVASDLITQNHVCAIIALTDKFLENVVEENEFYNNVEIPSLRMPFKNGYFKNAIAAKRWIDDFKPDWISLQYVPFAFQNKGLPLRLSKALQTLKNSCKLHIMFHELWVGMESESSLKLNFFGFLQKILIKSFIKRMQPNSISTNSELYKFQLGVIKNYSTILPLPSNIPVNTTIKCKNKVGIVKMLVFGNIHYGAPIESFAKELIAYCLLNNIFPEIIFIGKNGDELEKWVLSFKRFNINVKILGEQPEQIISEYLSSSVIGLTSTPYILLQKSGTVAAMRDNKIPVICIAREFIVPNFTFIEKWGYIFRYEENNLVGILNSIKSNKCTFPVYSTSNLFIKTLLINK